MGHPPCPSQRFSDGKEVCSIWERWDEKALFIGFPLTYNPVYILNTKPEKLLIKPKFNKHLSISYEFSLLPPMSRTKVCHDQDGDMPLTSLTVPSPREVAKLQMTYWCLVNKGQDLKDTCLQLYLWSVWAYHFHMHLKRWIFPVNLSSKLVLWKITEQYI